jgi:hypothetical protein
MEQSYLLVITRWGSGQQSIPLTWPPINCYTQRDCEAATLKLVTCGADWRLWSCIWWGWNCIENLSIDPGHSDEAECRSYAEYTVRILNNHPRFCSIKWEWDLPWSAPEHNWWSPLWIWFRLQVALAEPQVELVDDPAVPHRKKKP